MGRHVTKKPPKGVVIPVLKLILPVKVKNPAWTYENGDSVYEVGKGMISRPGGVPFYITAQVEVQILTVHFERNSMRVRYEWLDTVHVENMDATPFFKEFTISRP